MTSFALFSAGTIEKDSSGHLLTNQIIHHQASDKLEESHILSGSDSLEESLVLPGTKIDKNICKEINNNPARCDRFSDDDTVASTQSNKEGNKLTRRPSFLHTWDDGDCSAGQVDTTINMTPAGEQPDGKESRQEYQGGSLKISGGSYNRGSSGLFLNATSIITGTSKQENDEVYTKKFNRNCQFGQEKQKIYKDEWENRGRSLLCPSEWYRNPPSNSLSDWSWKMCFFCVCLPGCYPCYLTRTVRRRSRREEALERKIAGKCNSRDDGGLLKKKENILLSGKLKRKKTHEPDKNGNAAAVAVGPAEERLDRRPLPAVDLVVGDHQNVAVSASSVETSVGVMFLSSDMAEKVLEELLMEPDFIAHKEERPDVKRPNFLPLKRTIEGRKGDLANLSAIAEESRSSSHDIDEDGSSSPVVLRRYLSSITKTEHSKPNVEVEVAPAEAEPPAPVEAAVDPGNVEEDRQSVDSDSNTITGESDRYYSLESIDDAKYYSLPLPIKKPEPSRRSSQINPKSLGSSLASSSVGLPFLSARTSLTSCSQYYSAVDTNSITSGSGVYFSAATSPSEKFLSPASSLGSFKVPMTDARGRPLGMPSLVCSDSKETDEISDQSLTPTPGTPTNPIGGLLGVKALLSTSEATNKLSNHVSNSTSGRSESSYQAADESSLAPDTVDGRLSHINNMDKGNDSPATSTDLAASSMLTANNARYPIQKDEAGGSSPSLATRLAHGSPSIKIEDTTVEKTEEVPRIASKFGSGLKSGTPRTSRFGQIADAKMLQSGLNQRFRVKSVEPRSQGDESLKSCHPQLLGSITRTVSDHPLKLHIIKESTLLSHMSTEKQKNSRNRLPLLHMVVLLFSDDDEINKILFKDCGVMGYITEYWHGYFPLLMLKVSSDDSLPPSLSTLDTFSHVHTAFLDAIDTSFILDTIASFFLHEHIFQCQLHQDRYDIAPSSHRGVKDWACSGFCNLKSKPPKSDLKKTGKAGFLRSVKKTIILRRLTSQMSHQPQESDDDEGHQHRKAGQQSASAASRLKKGQASATASLQVQPINNAFMGDNSRQTNSCQPAVLRPGIASHQSPVPLSANDSGQSTVLLPPNDSCQEGYPHGSGEAVNLPKGDPPSVVKSLNIKEVEVHQLENEKIVVTADIES